MLSVDAPPFGPTSHSMASSLSMRSARHQLSATTATASSSCTTLIKPRIPLILSPATVASLPRNTGHCAIAAYAMPGCCTSIPKSGLPLTLSGMSSRRAGLPMRFHSLGSFSFTSFGRSSFEAACATWPKRSFLCDGVCVITPFSASHSDAGTFHLCAAAAISISRAVAPAWRKYSCESRIERLPPVAIEPHTRFRRTCSLVETNSVRTFVQSHSSSSATSMGRPVELPCPISERATRITTLLSGLMMIHAVSSGPFAFAAAAAPCAGIINWSARPPPAAVDTLRKSRRDLRNGIGISMAMWRYSESGPAESGQFCALSGPRASLAARRHCCFPSRACARKHTIGAFALGIVRPMTITRNQITTGKFNEAAKLPYELRLEDFKLAIRDVYDFFFDVNSHLVEKGLDRLDDMLRPAIMSGVLSDMLTASLARHSRTLVENRYFNGHPDLVVKGKYANNRIKAGEHGIEIKTTRKAGGAVDTHGARNQWMCVFVYRVDNESEPTAGRRPLQFTEVYLGQVVVKDFRKNPRGELGTRTATLHAEGIAKLRRNWIYRA